MQYTFGKFITLTLIASLLLLAKCSGWLALEDSSNQSGKPKTEISVQQEKEVLKDITLEESEISNKADVVENFTFSEANSKETSLKTTQPSKPYCLSTTNSAPTDAMLIHSVCEKISNRLASVTMESCVSARLQASNCLSVNNFPILFREFAPLENKKPQGRILVIGGTHGDELSSVSIVFRWIEKLNNHHSGLFHWHIVPVMNPDGLMKQSATRVNANGVDLNRNLPSDDWQMNALKYWKNKTSSSPRKFPGHKPASEPESQWLIDEIAHFKPDAILSIHAPYGVVDFDATSLNIAPNSLGKLRLNLLGTYPGSLGNYAGINLDIPVITLELPHAWSMPSHKETSLIWKDIVIWLTKSIGKNK